MNAEHSAESVRYARLAEDLVTSAHLNANEALVARILGDVAEWFEQTQESGAHAHAIWEVALAWALPDAHSDGSTSR